MKHHDGLVDVRFPTAYDAVELEPHGIPDGVQHLRADHERVGAKPVLHVPVACVAASEQREYLLHGKAEREGHRVLSV